MASSDPIQDRLRDLLRRNFRRFDPGGHIGYDQPGVNPNDKRALRFQFLPQGIGERPGGRFRRAIGGKRRVG